MSDETTRTDGWSSGETSSGAPEGATPSEPQSTAERVGFCQNCGKPLTQATLRAVGAGVFCEPCLTARVGATAPTSSYATVPPYTTVPPQAAVAGEPSPVLAALLGFIPGVGAMYNGQFAKGIVHLIIFAVLVSLSDNVNGIFGLFVAGWIFYMAFEAYHTAAARRDGLPLPNAFGFNDIGERMGFGRSWGAGSPAKFSGSNMPPAPGTAPMVDPASGSGYVSVNVDPAATTPDWVGYVPPAGFTNPPPPVAAAPWGHPYSETYTNASQTAYGAAVPPSVGGAPDLASRQFPTSALWLIALGVLILAANLLPDHRLAERWWLPVLFAGLSVRIFTRRLHSGARLVCIIRWPIVLMVLAVMLALHAAYFAVTSGLTISVLLIVFGALLLLERTAGASPVYTPPVINTAYPATSSPAHAEEARSRAAWAATDSGEARRDPDSTKGGQ